VKRLLRLAVEDAFYSSVNNNKKTGPLAATKFEKVNVQLKEV